jgi:hypothetical protein
MSRSTPPQWTPPHDAISEPIPDTLRTTPPRPEPELGDCDTIAVPLASADTLPCPRLLIDDLPTLRTSPAELAALIKLTQPAPARSAIPEPMPPLVVGRHRFDRPPAVCPPRPPTLPLPDERAQSADRTQAVRQPDPGQTRPIQRVPHADATLPAMMPPITSPIGRRPTPAVMHPPLATPKLAAGQLAMMPTQLWFAPGAPLGTVRKPAPRRWWARLWALFGRARTGKPPDCHPRYYRPPIMRR